MSDAEKLRELLERVEAADNFDREIDRAIGFALDGWRLGRMTGYDDADAIITSDGDVFTDKPGGMYPSFTESLDTAIALVEKVLPDGYDNGVYQDGKAGAHILHPNIMSFFNIRAFAATPALALCAALLKALIAVSEPKPTGDAGG